MTDALKPPAGAPFRRITTVSLPVLAILPAPCRSCLASDMFLLCSHRFRIRRKESSGFLRILILERPAGACEMRGGKSSKPIGHIYICRYMA